MKRHLTLILLALSLVFHPFPVAAETLQLEISGNGASAESTLEVNRSQEVVVVQDNQAAVDNQVNQSATTGDNQVTATGGDISLATGGVEVETAVTTGLNLNLAQVDTCCPAPPQQTTLTVTGNGTASQNHIGLASQTQITAVQTNQATLTNSLATQADTGSNTLSRNSGASITATTGAIGSQAGITQFANLAVAGIKTQSPSPVVVTIGHNGASSQNQISIALASRVSLDTANHAAVANFATGFFNTGGNRIQGNTASLVSLVTGDILSLTTIKNFVNQALAQVDTCCQEDPAPTPTPAPDPTPTPAPDPTPNPGSDPQGSGPGDPGNGAGGIGGGLGSVLGATLPQTGFDSNLLLLLNVALLLSGIALRFRPWELLLGDYQVRFVFYY